MWNTLSSLNWHQVVWINPLNFTERCYLHLQGGKVTNGPSKEGRKIFPERPQINTKLHGLKSQASASFAITVMRISNLIFHRTSIYPAIQVTVWSRNLPDKLTVIRFFRTAPFGNGSFSTVLTRPYHEAHNFAHYISRIYLILTRFPMSHVTFTTTAQFICRLTPRQYSSTLLGPL